MNINHFRLLKILDSLKFYDMRDIIRFLKNMSAIYIYYNTYKYFISINIDVLLKFIIYFQTIHFEFKKNYFGGSKHRDD